VYFAKTVAYFPFNSWLSIRLYRLLWVYHFHFVEHKKNFNHTSGAKGPTCITVPNLIKIGQTVAEIWHCNGFQSGGRPPSWICEIQIFNGRSG